MINERIEHIESKVQNSANLPESAKADLLELLAGLKSEVAALAETQQDNAQSIASFADTSTHEALQPTRDQDLLNAAIGGLQSSVQGLESSHPQLTQLVNRIAVTLSNMGI